MREILFRGKRTDNGEWVYGAFVSEITKFAPIIVSEYWADDVSVNYEYVQPETVGQYTGLLDKDHKRIFEGDVVKAYFRNNHSKQIFRVIFDAGMFRFDNGCVKVPKYDIYALEVIGNAHDNPELLGGTDNGE